MRTITLALLALGVVACGAQLDPPPPPPPPPSTPPPATSPPDAGGGAEREQGVPARTSVGLVVIDVQDTFVKYAAQKDIARILDSSATLLQAAGRQQAPLFVTYEHSKTDPGYALHAKLKSAMPAHAREFIKTTFAATGLESFSTAVKQSGLTHLVALGAETDVCVLQTVLGLRALGLTVILAEDAVFTSEPNTAPALRRMRQAGVLMATSAQAQRYLERADPLPAAASGGVRLVKPLAIAVVLSRLDDAALTAPLDTFRQAKRARLRELLLISEWFDMPLYGSHASLPAALKGLIKAQTLKPISALAQSATVEQIVVAGSGQEVAALVGAERSREVFIMEDALLAATAGHAATLESLYQGGSVPTTYKAFYYEMTRSIDTKQWPAKSWVDRFDEYYNKTSAPEDLPPIK